MQFFDAFTYVLLVVYFRFINKHWLPFQIFSVIMSFLSIVCCYFLPESPKYLYGKRRYDDARKALYYIQRFNNKKNTSKDFKFDLEIDETFSMSANEWVKSHHDGSLLSLIKDPIHR